MVQALIPRILDGQQGRREAHGIILYGDVIDLRVSGNVNEPDDFTGAVPPRRRRSMLADVEVRGEGGRRHVFKDCACTVPVKVGDPVVIEMPYGNPGRGAFVAGLQVPRRPLLIDEVSPTAAVNISAQTARLAQRIPVEYLGWPQAFAFHVQAMVAFDWTNIGRWDDARPTPARLGLGVRLEGKVVDYWTLGRTLQIIRASADLSKEGGQGRASFEWSGIAAMDGNLTDPLYPDIELNALAFYIYSTSNIVKWYDNDPDNPRWQTEVGPSITVLDSYRLQVVELGAATW